MINLTLQIKFEVINVCWISGKHGRITMDQCNLGQLHFKTQTNSGVSVTKFLQKQLMNYVKSLFWQ